MIKIQLDSWNVHRPPPWGGMNKWLKKDNRVVSPFHPFFKTFPWLFFCIFTNLHDIMQCGIVADKKADKMSCGLILIWYQREKVSVAQMKRTLHVLGRGKGKKSLILSLERHLSAATRQRRSHHTQRIWEERSSHSALARVHRKFRIFFSEGLDTFLDLYH